MSDMSDISKDIKSVKVKDKNSLNINDSVIQEALNISDNESLEKNYILEEGIVINPKELKIDIHKI